MPTHVSANVKELKELGKNLYAAMRADWEVNPQRAVSPHRLLQAHRRMVPGA
ncbi:MAG: hypothetical protein ACLSDW_07900 [Bifidobacterium longum]